MFAVLRLTTQREAKGAEKVYGGPGGSGVMLLAENLLHLFVSWCLMIAYTDSVRRKWKEAPFRWLHFIQEGLFCLCPPEDFLMSHWLNLWPHLANH